jgi:hypothetical protein
VPYSYLDFSLQFSHKNNTGDSGFTSPSISFSVIIQDKESIVDGGVQKNCLQLLLVHLFQSCPQVSKHIRIHVKPKDMHTKKRLDLNLSLLKPFMKIPSTRVITRMIMNSLWHKKHVQLVEITVHSRLKSLLTYNPLQTSFTGLQHKRQQKPHERETLPMALRGRDSHTCNWCGICTTW